MEKIILASASPRRRELLARAGISFQVRPGNGEEKITSTVPARAVEELSVQKARLTADMLSDVRDGTLVIGADTVVAFQGCILGKPKDAEDAVRTLSRLQGSTHQVYTGVTVLERKDGIWISHTFSEKTDVVFYPVSEAEIRAYVSTGEPMDKAGSYAIQGGFGIYVKEIRGNYENVVGLPVSRLYYEMKKIGIDLKG